MKWSSLAVLIVYAVVMGSVVYLARMGATRGDEATALRAQVHQDTLELNLICRTTQRSIDLATAWLTDPARADVAKTVITTLAPIRATCDHRQTP